MPDGLYDRDILEWSERQSALLRRIARGERLNESVDWPNVAEEIEAMGRSELRACESLLAQAIAHMLKLRAEPGGDAAWHWQDETAIFLSDAQRALSPSMRQRIDMADIYRLALRTLRRGGQSLHAVQAAPAICPFSLDELLDDSLDVPTLTRRLP